MNCATCRYSRWTIGVNSLWCEWHKKPCAQACADYEREPGAD